MLRIAVVFDADRRYILPFDVVVKTLKLSDDDVKKLETEIVKELHKEN